MERQTGQSGPELQAQKAEIKRLKSSNDSLSSTIERMKTDMLKMSSNISALKLSVVNANREIAFINESDGDKSAEASLGILIDLGDNGEDSILIDLGED